MVPAPRLQWGEGRPDGVQLAAAPQTSARDTSGQLPRLYAPLGPQPQRPRAPDERLSDRTLGTASARLQRAWRGGTRPTYVTLPPPARECKKDELPGDRRHPGVPRLVRRSLMGKSRGHSALPGEPLGDAAPRGARVGSGRPRPRYRCERAGLPIAYTLKPMAWSRSASTRFRPSKRKAGCAIAA